MSNPIKRIRAITQHLSNNSADQSEPSLNSSASQQNNNRSVYRTELTPLSFLIRTEKLYPKKPAVIYKNKVHTYVDFALRVRQYATALIKNLGIKPGDVVSVLMPNTHAMLESYFAIPLAGGIICAINYRLNVDEVGYILQKSKSTALVVDREFLSLIEQDAAKRRAMFPDLKHILVVEDTNTVETDGYEQFLASAGVVANYSSFPPLKDEEDVIAINWTSGSTGRPKGVMYTARGAYLNSLSEVLEMGMTPDAHYLWTLPMFHASGWCFPWALTAIGATSILLRKIDYDEIWRLFEAYPISHYCAAPTVNTLIVNHPKAKHLNQPIKVMVAGAPPSPTLLEGLMNLGITPVHVYGLTETYGPSTICAWQPEWKSLSPHQQAEYLSRQGQSFATADPIRVIDVSTGKDVPADGQTMGEVVFKGNLVMKGYLHEEEATRKAFEGGVFHSGDLGVMHPDGYIELRDRMKDIIISGGENISTIEVENAVTSHPMILEACVVSSPDKTWGERPVAYFTLKSPVADQEQFKKEVMVYLRKHLAGFKMPVRLEIIGELPKTSTGKVQKYIVRDWEWKRAGVTGRKIN